MATPIFTTGPSTSAFSLSTEFTAPLSEVLGAEADRAWLYSPLSSIIRGSELSEAQGDTQVREDVKELDPVSRLKRYRDGSAWEHAPDTGTGAFLDKDTAQEQITESKLPLKAPEQGITQGALDILIERKKNEQRLTDSLNRAESSVLTGAAQLATGLGVTILDPLNIASALIPVMGPARYANLLAQRTTAFSRGAFRANVGARSGAVGAAVVEPIILSAAQAEQAEYDMSDSLLNIAFGSILGGGLHAGGGAVKDALAARRAKITPEGAASEALDATTPAVREELGRSAVSQMASGRQVDVEIVGNFTPVRAVDRKVYVPGKGAQVITPNTEEVARKLNPQIFKRQDELQTRQSTLRRWLQELEEPRAKRAEGLVSDLDQAIQSIDAKIQKASAKNRKRLGREKAALEKERADRVAELSKGDTPDMAKVRDDLVKVDLEMRGMSKELSETLSEAKVKADASAETRQAEPPTFKVETVYERDRTPGIGKQIEETFSTKSKLVADVEAAAESRERVANSIESDDVVATENNKLAEAKEILDEATARASGEEAVFVAEDKAIKDAGDLRKAFDVATTCLTR